MLKTSKYCLLFLIASCGVLAQPLMAAEGIKGNPVSVSWLQQNLNSADILVVDASLAQLHNAQHIPGAVDVDLFSYGGQELRSPRRSIASILWDQSRKEYRYLRPARLYSRRMAFMIFTTTAFRHESVCAGWRNTPSGWRLELR